MRTTTATLLGLLLAACGGEGHAHGTADAPAQGGHAHAAPHAALGGVLVELGDHAAQLEVLVDPAAGELALYLFDGHAEEAARVTQPAIEVELAVGGEAFPLSLAARANVLTGETLGDSSEFRAADPRLVGARALTGTARSVTLRGATYRDVAFHWTAPDDEEHDG